MRDVEAEERRIVNEIFVEGAYRGPSVFAPGERWLDVGCHHGWWTIYAQSFGVEVVAGVDADKQACLRYAGNVGPGPRAIHAMVEGVDDIVRMHAELGGKFTGLKLDIQGAERDMFLVPDQTRKLGSLFDKVLLEWHHPNHLVEFVGAMDREWHLRWLDRTVDTMTGHRTFLAFASTK